MNHGELHHTYSALPGRYKKLIKNFRLPNADSKRHYSSINRKTDLNFSK